MKPAILLQSKKRKNRYWVRQLAVSPTTTHGGRNELFVKHKLRLKLYKNWDNICAYDLEMLFIKLSCIQIAKRYKFTKEKDSLC